MVQKILSILSYLLISYFFYLEVDVVIGQHYDLFPILSWLPVTIFIIIVIGLAFGIRALKINKAFVVLLSLILFVTTLYSHQIAKYQSELNFKKAKKLVEEGYNFSAKNNYYWLGLNRKPFDFDQDLNQVSFYGLYGTKNIYSYDIQFWWGTD